MSIKNFEIYFFYNYNKFKVILNNNNLTITKT